VVNLSLEDVRGLVAAQVGDGDAVVPAEAMGSKGDLYTAKEVIKTEGGWEVLRDLGHTL
jgi:hypothetical protein